MKYTLYLTLLIITVVSLCFSSVSAETVTNDEKTKIYCNVIIKSLTLVSLKARNKGTKKSKLVSELKSMEELSGNRQIKADIDEIANFVYNQGKTVSDQRVIDFIVDEWCVGQAHTFIYKK